MVYNTEWIISSRNQKTGPLLSSSSSSSLPGPQKGGERFSCPGGGYLQRVGEALSRALSGMDSWDGTGAFHRLVRPHVELGTAPVASERIENLQRIRRFRPAAPPPTSGSIKSEKGTTAPRESCLIEATSNSVRVSFLFKAQAKAEAANSSADPLEATILFQWMRFLSLQQQHPLLRKRPLDGYSITFLVTNKHLAVHGKGGSRAIEESILGFCSRIDKECSDIKLQVNAQARFVTSEFCKAFNQTDATASSSAGYKSSSGVALANE